MKLCIPGICLFLLASCVALCAQQSEQSPGGAAEPVNTRLAAEGRNVLPLSGIERPEDRGLRMHTHFIVHIPPGRPEGRAGFTTEEFPPDAIQPVTGDTAETPASLACLYGQAFVGQSPVTSCSETTATIVSTGGTRALAIVDAYDYPNALADLTAYSSQFGLPAPSLTVVFAGGTNPGPDPNCADGSGIYCWAAESALDIEMAHAAAPGAHIYLVEAKSAGNADLFAAVTAAVALLQLSPGGGAPGGGEVSMSWGGSEFKSEVGSDSVFTSTGFGVVFLASTGDEPGVQYPSTSPNVVAVGGTSVSRFTSQLVFHGELTWDQGGGGASVYEPRPSYQSSLASILGNHRGVPDVAAVANPSTGVWVYDSYETNGAPWNEIGGTSVAAPLWTGLVNSAGRFVNSTLVELTGMYTNAGKSAAFRNIIDGGCGHHYSYLATPGWDQCTGNGAPVSGEYH